MGDCVFEEMTYAARFTKRVTKSRALNSWNLHLFDSNFSIKIDQIIAAMHSVKLKIDDKIYDHLLKILRQFSKEELEIVEEDTNLQDHQQYLEAELKEINEGNATFY